MCVNASVCNSFCAKASVCKRFCVWKTIRRIGCKLVFCTCNILSWYYVSRLPKIHLYYIVLQYSVSILTTDDPALSLSPSFSLSLPLSLSPFLSIYVSLWLQDTCHMMPFTKQHSAYAWVVTCILFLINLTFHNLPLHSSYTGLSKWPSWKSNDETKFWVPQTKSNKQMMAISWISFSHTDRTPPINYWVFVSSITKGCFTKMKAWLEWQVNWISSRWNSICCSIFVE